jgi:CheY-like chemotaxis protein
MNRYSMPILIIDRQAYWRTFTAETLLSAGYLVTPISTYNGALQRLLEAQVFALVLLGCGTVGVEERLLIMRLLSLKQHIIVQTSSSLSAQEVRSLFLQKVEDASDKIYDPHELIGIVEQALERIDARKLTQFSLEREGYI